MKIRDDLLKEDIEYIKMQISPENPMHKENFEKLQCFEYDDGKTIAISEEGKSKKASVYEDELFAAFYMLKYATFYSIEYYIIYDIVVRLLNVTTKNRKNPVVFSFGSGSMIDALSLDYAYCKYYEQSLSMNRSDNNNPAQYFYVGTDLYNWPKKGHFDLINSELSFSHGGVGRFTEHCGIGMDQLWDIYDDPRLTGINCNILFFPKVLSELRGSDGSDRNSTIEKFCSKIKKYSSKFLQDEIFICTSYRGESTHGLDEILVNKIVDAFGKDYERVPESKFERYFNGVSSSWSGNYYFHRIGNTFISKKEIGAYDEGQRFHDLKISDSVIAFMKGDNAEIRSYCDDHTTAGCGHCDKCHFSPRMKVNYNSNGSSSGDNTCFSIVMLRKKGGLR